MFKTITESCAANMLSTMGLESLANNPQKLKNVASAMLRSWLNIEETITIDVRMMKGNDDTADEQNEPQVDKAKILTQTQSKKLFYRRSCPRPHHVHESAAIAACFVFFLSCKLKFIIRAYSLRLGSFLRNSAYNRANLPPCESVSGSTISIVVFELIPLDFRNAWIVAFMSLQMVENWQFW